MHWLLYKITGTEGTSQCQIKVIMFLFHLQGIAGQRGLQGVMGKAGPQVSTANHFKVNPGYSARFSEDK